MATAENTRQRYTGRKNVNESKYRRLGDVSEEEATDKASKGWINHFAFALILTPILCILILIFIPSNIEPIEYSGLSPPPALVGPIAPNNILSHAERIFEGKLVGPESIVVYGEHIYTGTVDGWVKHLYKGEVHKLVKFGKEPCEDEPSCGRPLGMRMDKNGFLIVCDAYYGLFQVNVATGDYEPLYLSSTPVNGDTPKFLNDLDFGPNGKIYFTDSSTKWPRRQFHNILLEGIPNGRLLVYDPENGKTEQVTGDILFANGVQLTADKSSVFVAECGRARIIRYDLKTKQVSIWADNLPGLPDNIRYDEVSGTYWVGLGMVRQAGKFSMFDFSAAYPWMRNMCAKMLSAETFLAVKNTFVSTDVRSAAIELDKSGTIIGSFQDKDGSVILSVSEVVSSNHAYYFGSFSDNCIGRLYKKKIPT